VLPWIKTRTRGFVMPGRQIDDNTERADLAAQRARLEDLVQRGLTSMESFAARVAKIDREMAKLDARRQAPEQIDRAASPDVINTRLRRLLHGIELGADFRPVKLLFKWEQSSVKGISRPIAPWRSEGDISHLDDVEDERRTIDLSEPVPQASSSVPEPPSA
jgi:hypothetical protein